MKDYRSNFSQEVLTLTGDACCDDPDIKVGRCPKTGLIQLVDFAHISESFYISEQYLSNYEQERLKQKGWNRKRIDMIFQYISDAKERKVLDYGSGSGAFLEAAHGRFKSLVGFDLSKKMCEENSKLGFECFNQMDEIPKDIEMITLFHVLEHIPDPWDVLDELKGKFQNADTFIVEVPNTSEALLTLYNNEAYRKNHFSRSHLYYFTNETLRLVVERAGLKVVVNTQLQRYSLANHLGWLSQNKGGGQDLFSFLNDKKLNDEYDRLLVDKNVADSVFIICLR